MFEKEKLIPLAALLLFAFAFVGLLWGDQIGWTSLIYRVPSYVLFGIAIVGLAFAWRFRPTAFGMRRGGWIMILVVLGTIMAWQFFSYSQGR